jgi:hypothetical protein
VDTKTTKVTQKVMALEASQPLCSNEHDSLKQEAGGGEIIVSMTEYDNNGTAVSNENMEATDLHTILEALDF